MPQSPGVYLYLNGRGKVIYVGKAKNLKHRVSSYFAPSAKLLGKTVLLVQEVKKIQIIQVESEIEALLLEANLIKKYAPQYNISMKYGATFPSIRITKKSLFPSVMYSRRMDDKKSVYFGPYPNGYAVRRVLKTMRRIFPYSSVVNHPKKVCLYYHLGLCPCPPVFPEKNEEYRKTIQHIIDFLHGKTKKILRELATERDAASRTEDFETAAAIQRQMSAITYVTNPPLHQPYEYETNPNLKTDLRMEEMVSLQKVLTDNDVYIALPSRIECYDISNTQGTNATASMVVLRDGEIDTSQYRKFKMHAKGPNDFAMIKEVLTRRMKHVEWKYPELIVVDGGKGQISSAKNVLGDLNITIPIIGLAKREEIIITSDFQEIVLPKRSPALQLIMRIRNEAHRFAITYHRKLRSKATFL